MQIVIPMAGRGSRFKDAGYTNPKPLIDVNGRPMISVVVSNIGLPGKYVFVALEEHMRTFPLVQILAEATYPCALAAARVLSRVRRRLGFV